MSRFVHDDLQNAQRLIRERTDLHPRIALVLGSGLGPLADHVQHSVSIAYGDIPGFPVSTAPGHPGRLMLGMLEEQPVAVLVGRSHMYEGYTAEDVVFPLRTVRHLGAEFLIITNAAGGVNPGFHPGTLMLITDHINLTGRNPLIGPNEDSLGPRFPDMSEAYDPSLRSLAIEAADITGIELSQGVYLGLLGPSYETPAEIRMARALGADAVGMSTVMEVIAANHMGMRILGVSCITNMAAGMLPQKLTEQEVIETAHAVRVPFTNLVERVVRSLESVG